MTPHRPLKTMTVLAFAAVALSGCASMTIQQPAVAELKPGQGRIVFADPAFKGTHPVHVAFTDPWQREEYALFKSHGAQSEILYSTTQPGYEVALQYNFTVKDSVDTWNLNRKYAKSWGRAAWFRSPLTGLFYQPYTLLGANRQCFGFSGGWNNPPDDPDARPGKVLFGYYCAASGQALPRQRMEDLLSDIGIRGITEPLPYAEREHPTPSTANQPAAIKLAQGGAGNGDSGNLQFPFDLARHYPTYGDDGNDILQ